MSIGAMWKGWNSVMGDRSMYALKDAFGADVSFKEDPAFQKDMAEFQQNPTTYNADKIITKWGGDNKLGVEDYKQLANYIRPTEGTLARMEEDLKKKQTNLASTKTGIEQDRADTLNKQNYGEKAANLQLGKTELGLAQNNYDSDRLAYMQENKPYQEKIDANISSNKRSMAEDDLAVKKVELALENNLPEFQIETQIAQLDAQKAQALYNKLMNQQKVDDAEKLYDLFMRKKVAGTETAEANRDITQTNAEVAEATSQYKIDSAAENLEQLMTQGDMLDDKNYISGQTRDNKVAQENFATQLARIQMRNARDKRNFMQNLDPNTRYGVETGAGGEEAIDIKYTIPNPYNDEPLASNQRGIVVNRRTGEPFVDEYGQYYMAGKSQYSDNIQIVPYGGESYGGNSQTKNVLTTTQQLDFDTEPKAPWYEGALETLKNYISGDNGNNENQQSMGINQVIQTYRERNPDLSYREMADRMEQNIDPKTFKQQTGQNLNAVIGRLRMMRGK